MVSESDHRATATEIDSGLDGAATDRQLRDDGAGAGLSPGSALGRYVVLATLGSGAMGIVYAAYDPELDRKVAIKLLLSDDAGERARTRLQREAQALARLSHPHVVAVHDVGVHGDRVFIAMEFVDGLPLSDWLDAEPGGRDVAEILRVFVEAGRGLAAAHEHGLIHRDFKPDNVMIDRRGRVRVMDFGLARAVRGASSQVAADAPRPHASASAVPLTEAKLTRTGSVMGTPAYMSPEQHMGLGAGPASDQFSYFVALYEALWRERPFGASTMAALALAVTSGEIKPPPRDGRVTDRVIGAITRGLNPEPNQRWPSMDAAITELVSPTGARRPLAIYGVAGAAVVAGAIGLWFGLTPEPDPCASGADRVAEVWNDTRKAAIADGLGVGKLDYATPVYDRLEGRVDDYVAAWATMHRSTCEATRLRHEQSDEALDLRMACLEGRLSSLDSSLSVVGETDPSQNAGALDVIEALPSLERCADLDLLRAAVPPPDDTATAQRVAALRKELQAIDAIRTIGRHEESLERARNAVVSAGDVDYRLVHAEARWQAGQSEHALGHYGPSVEHFDAALATAIEVGDDDLAREVASENAVANAHGLREYDTALPLARLGLSLARRRGDHRAEVEALIALGNVGYERSDHEFSVDHHRRALELTHQNKLDHAVVARAEHALGRAYFGAGKYQAAVVHFERALALREEVFGPNHPNLGETLQGMGLNLEELSRHDDAREVFERSLQIRLDAFGEQHVDTAQAVSSVGGSAFYAGEYVEAEQMFRRATAIAEKTAGPGAMETSVYRLNVARALYWQERYEPALAQTEIALEARLALADGEPGPEVATAMRLKSDILRYSGSPEAALELLEDVEDISIAYVGRDHPDTFFVVYKIAVTLETLGRRDDAIAKLQQALDIAEKTYGPDSDNAAFPLAELGPLLLEAGKPDESIAALERAYAIRRRTRHKNLPDTRTQLVESLAARADVADRARIEALKTEGGPR